MSEGDLIPSSRSGHSAIVLGSKMFVFGGILEVTQELNDLVVFDLISRKFESIQDSSGMAEKPGADTA